MTVIDWKICRCGDIVDVRDGTHDTPEKQDKGIPLVTSKNLTPQGIDFKKVSYISQDAHREIERRSKVDDGDILFAMIGTIGNALLVKKDREFSIKNVALFKLDKSNVDPRFFLYLLSSHIVTVQLDRKAKGGNQKFVSLSVLRDLEIPLPPLSEQKRIADILDKADAIRRKRQDAIQYSENILRSAYLHLFGDPVANPQGWPVEELGTIADMVTGFAFKSNEYVDEGIRLCRGANVLPDRIDWSDVRYWRSSDSAIDSKMKLNIGDVALAMDRPWISSGIKVAQLSESDLPAYLVQRVTRLRGKGFISNAFLYHTIRHPAFTAHCGGLKTETTIPYISSSDIKSFRVPVAPKHVHKTFETLANKLQAGYRRRHRAMEEANSLFNSLVQNAFKGCL